MEITAVSGYKAVGRNMTGVTVGRETIAIDNGIRLDTLQMYDDETTELKKRPREELIKLDVIPDMSRLKNVSAQVISHGHLDHVGAVGLNRVKVPIITTHYAAEIGRREHPQGNFYSADFRHEFDISHGVSVEFVEVTHSIPQTSITVLHTPEGDVVYASDYKFDDFSKIAKTDYRRLKELGQGNVCVLIAESTRVSENGKTPTEETARVKLREVMDFIDSGLITATTFSTHIERIQAIIDEAERFDRRILILGRSLHNQVKLAEKFDLLDLPPDAGVFGTSKAMKNALKGMKRREDYLLLVTGHQGEQDSMLVRMVDGKFPFEFKRDDSLLFCSNVIPSPINEANRYALETKLSSKGVRIFRGIHASGHASKEDHRRLIKLLQPDHIIPCHGGIKLRSDYVSLASEEGYELNRNLHLLNNGLSIKI